MPLDCRPGARASSGVGARAPRRAAEGDFSNLQTFFRHLPASCPAGPCAAFAAVGSRICSRSQDVVANGLARCRPLCSGLRLWCEEWCAKQRAPRRKPPLLAPQPQPHQTPIRPLPSPGASPGAGASLGASLGAWPGASPGASPGGRGFAWGLAGGFARDLVRGFARGLARDLAGGFAECLAREPCQGPASPRWQWGLCVCCPLCCLVWPWPHAR